MYLSLMLLVVSLTSLCAGYETSEDHEKCNKCRSNKSFQNLVCQADFAARIKVIVRIEEYDRMRFLAYVIQLFNAKKYIPEVWENEWLVETPPTTSPCSIDLYENEQYIITGLLLEDGRLYMDQCTSTSYHISEELPYQIGENFSHNFLQNCNCQVLFISEEEFASLSPHELDKITEKTCLEDVVNIQCINPLRFCYWGQPENKSSKRCLWSNKSEEETNFTPCRESEDSQSSDGEPFWAMAGMNKGNRGRKQ